MAPSGAGDGTFGPEARYLVGAGPVALAAADFNGDGAPDLATANVASTNLTVLLSRKGAAGGRAAAPRPSAERARAARLSAADAVFAGSRLESPEPLAAPPPVAAAVAAGRAEALPAPPDWADAGLPPRAGWQASAAPWAEADPFAARPTGRAGRSPTSSLPDDEWAS
jgi:hypothetical protein